MQIVNESSLVLSILEERRLVMCNTSGGVRQVKPVCSDSVTKVYCSSGLLFGDGTFSLHSITCMFVLHLVSAEALQGGADCADHQRCLSAATTTTKA